MRGQVLGVDPSGGGTISGSDGSRYTFAAHDWRGGGQPPAGAEVDFITRDGTATEIFPLPPSRAAMEMQQRARPSAAPPGRDEGSSVLLGGIGIACLIAGFVIPVVPTVAAFILGLIGASSAKRHNNSMGLTASRIAWIGSIVFTILAAILIVFATLYAWPFFEAVWNTVLEEARRNPPTSA